jgi:hypothetical protein
LVREHVIRHDQGLLFFKGEVLKRGRAICRLVREHVIRHDQGLLVFKGGASFWNEFGRTTDRQTDRQAEQFTSRNLVFDLI